MNIDHNIWQLVQNVVATRLDEGAGEEDIVIEILKITHGVIAQDSIQREIVRQKRMVVN